MYYIQGFWYQNDDDNDDIYDGDNDDDDAAGRRQTMHTRLSVVCLTWNTTQPQFNTHTHTPRLFFVFLSFFSCAQFRELPAARYANDGQVRLARKGRLQSNKFPGSLQALVSISVSPPFYFLASRYAISNNRIMVFLKGFDPLWLQRQFCRPLAGPLPLFFFFLFFLILWGFPSGYTFNSVAACAWVGCTLHNRCVQTPCRRWGRIR